MAQLIKASNESLVQEFTVTDATGSTPENVIINCNVPVAKINLPLPTANSFYCLG